MTTNQTQLSGVHLLNTATLQADIAAFLRSRRADGCAVRTIEWYEQQLAVWLGWLGSQKEFPETQWLSADALDAYLEWLRNRVPPLLPLSDNTIAGRYRAVSALCHWCRRRERPGWEKIPTDKVDAPRVKVKQPRRAEKSGLDRIMATIGRLTWLDMRDRTLIELMRSTGIRVEEAIDLKLDDFDVSERFIFIEAGKGDKPRIVPFDGPLLAAFIEYRFNRPNVTCDRVFIAADGHQRPIDEPMTTDAVRSMMRRRCVQANVAHINPHSIRHFFATDSLNRGMKLSALSAMLGHSSVSFTAKVYAKWVKSGLRKEYDAARKES